MADEAASAAEKAEAAARADAASELIARVADLVEAMEHDASLEWQSYEAAEAADATDAACVAVLEGRAVLEAFVKAARKMGCTVSKGLTELAEDAQLAAAKVVDSRQQSDLRVLPEVGVPAERKQKLDDAREAFEHAAYRKKKYGAEAAPAMEEATDRIAQLVSEATERVVVCAESAQAAETAEAKAVELRAATASAWAAVAVAKTDLEASLIHANDAAALQQQSEELKYAVGKLRELKVEHEDEKQRALDAALTQRRDAMGQAAMAKAEHPLVSYKQPVCITEGEGVRVLESDEKRLLVADLVRAREVVEKDLDVLRAVVYICPTVLRKAERLRRTVSELRQLPHLSALSVEAATALQKEAAAADVDKKHALAEGLANHPKHKTDLEQELQTNFDLASWKEKDGGDFTATLAAVGDYISEYSEWCEDLKEDDLVAARVYTRTVPDVSREFNGAIRLMMKDPGDPPWQHVSMYVHLSNAATELKGAAEDDPLYRGQKNLYGSDPELEPEDPAQYAEGRIVHWPAFTSTFTTRSKSLQHATATGVLFVIEPPFAEKNLGVALNSPLFMGDRNREDEVLLPAGSAFRVLSCEEMGGFRTITLKHLGAWVSDAIYARKEVGMPEAVGKLQQSVQMYREAAAGAEQEKARKMSDMSDLSEAESEGPVGAWTPAVSFASVPNLHSKALKRSGMAQRLSSHFKAEVAADYTPDPPKGWTRNTLKGWSTAGSIAVAKAEADAAAAEVDAPEIQMNTLRVTILVTESADPGGFGGAGTTVFCRVAPGGSSGSNGGGLPAAQETHTIYVPGEYIRSVTWPQQEGKSAGGYMLPVESLAAGTSISIELRRFRVGDARDSVLAAATIDLSESLDCYFKRNFEAREEWYEYGSGVAGRVKAELAWLP